MNLERKVDVVSRAHGSIVYKIDHLNVRRVWQKSGDVRQISIKELMELNNTKGGPRLLREYLVIKDQEAVNMLLGDDLPPEYSYTDKEIDFLLYEGTVEQLMDCLDFAPEGALALIKAKAIDRKPDTTAKVSAINKKFGIDLDGIIRNNAMINEGAVDSKTEQKEVVRRAAPVLKTEEVPVTPTPKYKVINKGE